jgi:predicted nucleic acid-binding protein
LIAATADALGATVVTRNVRDFTLLPVPIEEY